MFHEEPTAKNTPEPEEEVVVSSVVVVSTVKEVIASVLLEFPAESVTIIVQLE